jgi:hypothetical protein
MVIISRWNSGRMFAVSENLQDTVASKQFIVSGSKWFILQSKNFKKHYLIFILDTVSCFYQHRQ